MARYHINNQGNPGLCKASKKCPFGGAEAHYDNPAEAMAAFEAMQGGSFESPAFKRSKVRDEKGNLLTVYHGTDYEFDSFDSSYTGKGNDAYGSGFYFSNDQATARGYGKHMKEVQLAIENPLVIDGRSGSLMDVEIPQDKVVEFLKAHPDIYLGSKEAEETDRFNPLGDYLPEYWDKESWTKPEIDRMLQKVAKEYFDSPNNYVYLTNLFGEEHATAFRVHSKEILGWDGVRIDFEDGLTHWVAWFPEQIRIVS